MENEEEPNVERNRKGEIIAMRCQECGQRLKPVHKSHTKEDCDWYKRYTQQGDTED